MINFTPFRDDHFVNFALLFTKIQWYIQIERDKYRKPLIKTTFTKFTELNRFCNVVEECTVWVREVLGSIPPGAESYQRL